MIIVQCEYCGKSVEKKAYLLKKWAHLFCSGACQGKWKTEAATAKVIKDFWNDVDVKGPDDCWEWKRGRSKQGYGAVKFVGRTAKAHRLAWILGTHVPIPKGMKICHT